MVGSTRPRDVGRGRARQTLGRERGEWRARGRRRGSRSGRARELAREIRQHFVEDSFAEETDCLQLALGGEKTLQMHALN